MPSSNPPGRRSTTQSGPVTPSPRSRVCSADPFASRRWPCRGTSTCSRRSDPSRSGIRGWRSACCTTARDLLGLVAEGTADFAITPLTHRTTPAVRFDPILSTPLVLLCPPAHRLAGARDVELGDVVDEPLIDLPRGWWVRELFDGMFAERSLPRRVRLEMDEWFGVLTMVRRGVGIACGPLACVDETLVGDVSVATLDGAPTWELGIATRDEALRGAAGRAFLDAYRRQCRERLGD